MIRDHSSAFDPKQEEGRRDYLLRSEILAITSIFYRQMHEMVWLPAKDRYKAKLVYKEGLLMVCFFSSSLLRFILIFHTYRNV